MVNCVVLIDAHHHMSFFFLFALEIARLQRGGAQPSASDPNAKQTQKVYIPYEDQRKVRLHRKKDLYIYMFL